MIFVLTGSGTSAESGLRTFRSGGLWNDRSVEDVATMSGFRRDPDGVCGFYDELRVACAAAAPNPAHDAVTRLQRESGEEVFVVTQNIDDLHERSGTRGVVHMHGSLIGAVCASCGVGCEPKSFADAPRCGCGGRIRPNVTWFGEMPQDLDVIMSKLREATTFISVGTSGEVYPAADFPRIVRNRKRAKRMFEINTEMTSVSRFFRVTLLGPASSRLPSLVDELLSSPDAPRPQP